MMALPGLIIFDCDGVLVDTETIANTRLAALISEAGLPITMEECRRRFVGLSMKTVRQMLRSENDLDLGDDFVSHWNNGLPKLFEHGLQAIPDVKPAILKIGDAGIDTCVASSGKIEKMHITLGTTGLLSLMEDVLFSASMVERGKPFPDLFLHAAAQMGHEPGSCIVIEDSVPGVKAGVAAGMKVLGYCGDPLTDADGLAASGATIYHHMRQLPGLLGLG